MKKGDIILVPFPFTDLSGGKVRPALVLIEGTRDATVSFISTQTHLKEDADILIQPTRENGLKKESLIRLKKITTIDRELIIGKLGTIKDNELEIVDEMLLRIFKIHSKGKGK